MKHREMCRVQHNLKTSHPFRTYPSAISGMAAPKKQTAVILQNIYG
jgi:hypothetical protein